MPSGDAHRSLARALDILELCSQNGVGYTLTQLSQQLGIAKGSISPLLHTLQDRGYLTLDEQDHHYRIGRMAFRIGNTYLDEASALREIHRLMKDIVAVCHETCHLGCLKNGDVYYLKKVESTLYSHTVSVEGRSLPAYATGVGKALLAEEKDAGLHFLMKIDTELTDEIICQRAAAKGIRIMPLSKYYYHPEKAIQHILVVNYSSLTQEQMTKATQAFNEILG